jgi:DNA-binding response OmpR family regulator
MKANILIVEDESIVAIEIESYLLSLNYNVVALCSTADEAYEKAIQNDVDLVLMDIYLIESNGIDATARIKKVKPYLPIIFLSAYMDEETIDRAIEVDPQAYLMKPFKRKELSVAIRIGLNSKQSTLYHQNQIKGDIFLDSEFTFDSKTSELICCGEVVGLTKKERILIQLFLKYKNRLLSISLMEYTLWPDKPSNDSRRRSLISRLRAKLRHRFIRTHASEGYIFKIQ